MPPRVLQVDARRLDEELLRLIAPGWTHCVRFFTSSAVSEEASAFLLAAAVHALTVVAGRPPPGAAMLGLDYAHARLGVRGVPAVVWRRRFVHFLVSVALPGAHKFVLAELLRRHRGALEARLALERQEQHQRRQAEHDTRVGATATWSRARVLLLTLVLGSDVALEALARVVSLVHSLLFVSSRGAYRSLADHLSGLPLEYGDRSYEDGGRMLSFDYLNQQLAFRETSDLFRVVLPAAAAAASAIAGAASAAGADIGLLWRRAGAATAGARAAGASSAEDALVKMRQEVDVDDVACSRCGCVGNHAPYVTLPCLHVYCYYCIAQHAAAAAAGGVGVAAGAAPRCVVCYQRIESVAPLRKRLLLST